MSNDEFTFEITTAVAQALLEAGSGPSASEPSASGVSSVCGNSSLNTSLCALPYKKDNGRLYINSGGAEIPYNGPLWNGKFFRYYNNGVQSNYYTYSEPIASNPITSEPSASEPSASGVSSVCGNSSLNTSLCALPYKKDNGRLYINSGGAEIPYNGRLWNGNLFRYYSNGYRSNYYTYS